MDNATRRQLLQRHKISGFTGSIIDVFKAYEQGIDIIGQFEQQQMQAHQKPQASPQAPSSQISSTPPPQFNTAGVKPVTNAGQNPQKSNLVESYNPTPPGISNLTMNS